MKWFIKLFWFLISAVFTYILFCSIDSEGGVKKIFTVISSGNIKLISAYCLLSIIGLYIRAKRAHLLLDNLNFRDLLLTFSIRNLTVDLLPARIGEFAYLIVLKKLGVELKKSCASLFILTIIDLAILFLIVVSIFLVSNYPFLGLIFFISGSFAFLYSLQFFSIKYLNSDIAINLKQNAYKLFSLTILLRVIKYASLYLLLLSFSDIVFLPAHSTIAFILAEGSTLLPFSGIMGFGAYEKSWTLILNSFAYEIPEPTILAFSIHVTSQVVGYLIGLIYIGWYGLRNKEITSHKKMEVNQILFLYIFMYLN